MIMMTQNPDALVVTTHLGFVIQSYGRRRTRGVKEKKPPGQYNAVAKRLEGAIINVGVRR